MHGFKIGKSNHRRCLVKNVFLKILQNWQKRTCDLWTRVRHGFSTVSFTKFWKTLFFTKLPGDYFWWRSLMAKNFNSVLLIFLNSELYHAPPEWWLLFWCNEEYILIQKTWPSFKWQTIFWHYFKGSLAEVFKVVFIIFQNLKETICVRVSV